MPIIFETTGRYGEPEGHLYQELARDYLLGKRFGSLEEALDQMHEGKPLSSYGFFVDEIKVQPRNLPTIITEVDIFVRVRYEGQHPAFFSEIPVLKARLVD